jgi:hypothetical protein
MTDYDRCPGPAILALLSIEMEHAAAIDVIAFSGNCDKDR